MEKLLRFCQRWAKEHGCAVFKAQSNANKNFYICCDCSGEYCGPIINAFRSKTATSKIMSPFIKVKGSIPTSKKITNKTRDGKQVPVGGYPVPASRYP
jgi:hypothetical protein